MIGKEIVRYRALLYAQLVVDPDAVYVFRLRPVGIIQQNVYWVSVLLWKPFFLRQIS